MNKIIVLGHISPDLDSVSSAYLYSEYLKLSNKYPNYEIIPAVSGKVNAETEFVFSKAGTKIPDFIENLNIGDQDLFILTDHNEVSQRHSMVQNEKIIEIIDHHKVNVNFSSPINIDIRTLGSTSSIIFDICEKQDVLLSKESKIVMLSAVLSDTQGLRSNLTTEFDKRIGEELSKDMEIDLNNFTKELFKVKSDISGFSIEEIVRKDYKVFEFGLKKVFINQIETVEPSEVESMKEEILTEMKNTLDKDQLDYIFVVITDILEMKSKIIYLDESKEVVEKAFNTHGESNIADIGARTSRKKDIAPEIEKSL